MGARREYGKSKTNVRAVFEGNGQAAKGEEENDTKEGVRNRRFLDNSETLPRHCCVLDQGYCLFKRFLEDDWRML